MVFKIILMTIYSNIFFFGFIGTIVLLSTINIIRKEHKTRYIIHLVMIPIISLSYFSMKAIMFDVNELDIVAHAGGTISEEDAIYLNSREGFIEQYNNGTRIFEVDFLLTSDNELVAAHLYDDDVYGDAFKDGDPSLSEFTSFMILDRYHTMSIDDLKDLLIEYDDVKIVVDTKEEDYMAVYSLIVDSFEADQLDRVIPQLFYKVMYQELEAIYSFSEYWFTVYLTEDSLENIITFCEKTDKVTSLVINQYKFVTMSIYRTLEETELDVYAYTIDSKFYTYFLHEIGIDGIYSDKLH